MTEVKKMQGPIDMISPHHCCGLTRDGSPKRLFREEGDEDDDDDDDDDEEDDEEDDDEEDDDEEDDDGNCK